MLNLQRVEMVGNKIIKEGREKFLLQRGLSFNES